MSRPEGYPRRAALRPREIRLPVFTCGHAGAYPGLDAEARGQSRPSQHIYEMASWGADHYTVIGEGGSGGALAISWRADQVVCILDLFSLSPKAEHPSVKTSEKAQDAADAMGITAHRLKALGLVDKIVNEPVGGAHRDPRQMAAFLKRALNDAWRQVSDLKVRELVDRRYERLQSYGRYTDTKADTR